MTESSSLNYFKLDNSGYGPLQVPRFNDVPLFYELDPEQRFAHGAAGQQQAYHMTARELAMLNVMDDLTDVPDWHVKVFNDDVVEKWCAESIAMPLMRLKAQNWCLAELRDKAILFRKSGSILALDGASAVVKSDTLITPELQSELRTKQGTAMNDKDYDFSNEGAS